MNELKRLEQLVSALGQESSTIVKKEILRNYKDLKTLLKVIYDPLYIFYVTGDNVERFLETEDCTNAPLYYNIFELLEELNCRKITGNNALTEIGNFIYSNNPGLLDLYVKIFNKDLKCGISVKTINSVFKNLIPEFNVPLAKEYEEGMYDFESETWFVSRKLDGIRCLCFVENLDHIEFYSRNGIRFETLENLKPYIKKFLNEDKNINNLILDGEICLTDNQGNEDFKLIASEIRKKNHQIKNPKFFIFDSYPINNFLTNLEVVKPLHLNLSIVPNAKVELLKQTKVNSKYELFEMVKNLNEKWEGLILRKYPTQFKRSHNLLKLKKFKDIDLKVESIEVSEKFINGHLTPCVGSLIVKYKNNIVKVGSGLTDEQRTNWLKDRSQIEGKIITIKYFSESEDKDKNKSLRFPIFKGVRNYE